MTGKKSPLHSLTVIRARASMTGGSSRRELFPYRVVGGLGLVRSIKRQRVSASAVRMGSNPGVFVGGSPGLDRSASGIVQASSYDAPINLGLPSQVFSPRGAAGIERQRNVQLRDVNLHSQRRKPGDV